MTTLGEAFIAVRADMSPFRRNLKDEVKKSADEFETQLSAAIEKGIKEGSDKASESAGRESGRKFGRSFGSMFGDSKKSPWIQIAGAFGSALDHGISALPTEIKAAIVVSLLALAPIITAGIAGAISAGVVAGTAGLGIALASQFESVQERWTQFLTESRNLLVASARPFERVMLEAIEKTQERLEKWEPMLDRIFSKSAMSFDDIFRGLFDGVEFFLDSLDLSMDNAQVFADALGDVLRDVGAAAGEVLEILTSTGEDGADAFRDLVHLATSFAVVIAEALAIATRMYGFIRGIAQAMPDWVGIIRPEMLLIKGFANEVDNASGANIAYAYTHTGVESTILGVIAATKDEEKALQDLEKAIKDAQDALWDTIDTNIAYERSLDKIEESIKRNGKTLNIETEEGRQNLEAIGRAIKLAQEKAEQRAASGKFNAKQLTDAYNAEIERIYKAAEAQGISRDRLREIYGTIIDIVMAPPPNTQWAVDLANALARAAAESRKIKVPGAYGDFDQYGRPLAEGGIVRAPTAALIGEAGTEVVIPMTKPARAAELMRQSGLDRMLGGAENISVAVYLGNEAFDQHVQKIVIQDNRSQARQLTYGAR